MQKGDLRGRFFIAVFPPPEIAAKVEKIMLKGPRNRGWGWSRKEDLHISLGFPGALAAPELEKLKKALAAVVHRAFKITVKGMDAFFDNKNNNAKEREHVLWLQPASPSNLELKTLQRAITTALKEAFPASGGGGPPFSPHMTVAKINSNDHDAMKEFAAASQSHAAAWICRSFGLYEKLNNRHPEHPASNRGRGSKFKKIAEYNLDG